MGMNSILKTLKRSFRAKIFVMAAAIIIVISSSFTLFIISHDSTTHVRQISKEGELLANLLAHNATLGAFSGDAAMLHEPAEGILRRPNVLSVSISGRGGQVLLLKTKSQRKDLPEPAATPQPFTSPISIVHENCIEAVAPILVEGSDRNAENLFFEKTGGSSNALGTVRVLLDKSELNDRMAKLILFALLSMGLFLLLGSFCAYLMARSITKPLTALTDCVNVLGYRGLYNKVPVTTEDEVGALATAFNDMVDNLERRESENRQLEEQLRHIQEMEAKEEWEQTFDTVPDLIAILDQERRIVRINRAMAEHFQVSHDEVIGLDCEDACRKFNITGSIFTPIDGDRPGTGFESEVYGHERDCWYWITVSQLKRQGKQQGGTVHVARDITLRKRTEAEKKAMQAKLIQTNKMASLGLLVSGMAHEVNNPNSNIIFAAHLLSKTWTDAEPILDRYHREHGDFRIGGHWYSDVRGTLLNHITGIRENSRRIERIIKDLKDFVRKGKSEVSTEMDVNRIISVAASLINNQIKNHTARFEMIFAEDLPPARGNPQQLEQVFINLIMNALQALGDKNRMVRVTTGPNGNGWIRVTIEDEGCGMTPDVRENIFEPFFSTKLQSGGTGLGLAISKFILDEHKALIEFQSEPEKGTTVTVLLPGSGDSASMSITAA